MAEVSLQQQIQFLLGRVWRLHSQLPAEDPIRDWIVLEATSLEESASTANLLHDANAVLRALKQLNYLVQYHLKEQNRNRLDPHETPQTRPESSMTVMARLPGVILEMSRQYRFSIEPSLLFQLDRANDQFDPVSPTAKVVGYLRGLDPSLRFAANLSFEEEGRAILKELEIVDEEALQLMAFLFQSRHHIINAAIASESVHQVVELASGISPRGLQWARTSPDTIYVESDLPDLMVKKAKMIRDFLMQEPNVPPGILHCGSADVLNEESLRELLESVDLRQPVVIVTEGLLLYFEESELRQFFGNMKRILTQFPRVSWVTDLVTQENLSQLISCHPGVAQGVRRIFELTGRSVIRRNPFASDASVEAWVREFDLNIKSRWPLNRMTALLKSEASVTTRQCQGIVGSRQIWQIDVRKAPSI